MTVLVVWCWYVEVLRLKKLSNIVSCSELQGLKIPGKKRDILKLSGQVGVIHVAIEIYNMKINKIFFLMFWQVNLAHLSKYIAMLAD